MNKLLTYSGIITKIKSLESNYITADDYMKISNLETISDFIIYLKNHPGYNHIFKGLDEHDIHRSQIEGIIINVLYKDFTKIYVFSNMEQRAYLELIFFRYEINILKTCIQLNFGKSGSYDLSIFGPFFEKHSKLNIKALLTSKNMEEFIHNLKGSKYYDLFSKLSFSNLNTSFDYEIELDIYYFKKAWKLKDKVLTDNNQTLFTTLLGTEIDLQNIMWLYRAKRYYDTSSSDHYAHIIPINYKLTKDKLVKLIESSSLDEFVSIVKSTYYNEFGNSLMDGTMEVAYNHILSKQHNKCSSRYPNSMAPVHEFLFHKRDEIDRLTTALECIRYKLEPSTILKYLYTNYERKV